MPEAVMATKSTDQGWPPPPTKSKCLERVSSRYVRRRMAAALLARVGIGSIGCCQKSSSQFRPRLVPRGAGPVLTVRRSLPVYLTNRHARCRSAGLKGAKDRDRGEPHGSAPPTLPYVRVRIRRVEKVRQPASVAERGPRGL